MKTIRYILALFASMLLLVGGKGSVGYGQEIPRPDPSIQHFVSGGAYSAFFAQPTVSVLPPKESGPAVSGSESEAEPQGDSRSSQSGDLPDPLAIGPNIRVNAPQLAPPFGRSETTIAVAKSEKIAVGWNDAEGFVGFLTLASPGLSGFGFSADGGQTFTDGGGLPKGPTGIFTLGDPYMDVNKDDEIVYSNLALELSTGLQGISVHVGEFDHDVLAFGNPVLAASTATDFLDKSEIAADPKSDLVVVSYTRFLGGGGFGQIELARSTDGGRTFGPPTVIQPAEFGNVNQGSAPVVGESGEVFVAWERGGFFPFSGGTATPQIAIATSTNEGATFGPRVKVADICATTFFPPGGYNRPVTNDFPRVAVARDGHVKGRIFVTFQSCAVPFFPGFPIGQDGDVFLSFSDDGGATWSTPTLVNPTAGDGKLQFWPVVSVRDSGKVVDVTYYESVEVGGLPPFSVNSLVDVFTAQSFDGGVTFQTPIKVTSVTSNWGAAATSIVPNFGDYIHAVGEEKGEDLLITWADGRNGVPDTFFARGED